MVSQRRSMVLRVIIFCFGVPLVVGALASGCEGNRVGGNLDVNPKDGKGTPYEAATVDLIADLNEAADILSAVEDEQSAEKAEPKLKVVASRLRKTMKQFKAFSPSRAEESRLRTKYWESLNKAARRLRNEMTKVAGIPEAQFTLRGALDEFEKMQEQRQKKQHAAE